MMSKEDTQQIDKAAVAAVVLEQFAGLVGRRGIESALKVAKLIGEVCESAKSCSTDELAEAVSIFLAVVPAHEKQKPKEKIQ